MLLLSDGVIVGVYIVLTISCIIKKVWYFKSTNFSFLWLILYNEFVIAVSIYTLWTPGPDYVPGTTIGYLPGEFIILTTIPLVLIGFIMKLIFLARKQADQANLAENRGSLWYVIISSIPTGFTFCMAAGHLTSVPMWLPLYLVGLILLPLLCKLYQFFKPRH